MRHVVLRSAPNEELMMLGVLEGCRFDLCDPEVSRKALQPPDRILRGLGGWGEGGYLLIYLGEI